MEINRQYIGARYVPKFATPTQWDKTQSYEALTIVTNLGNSYTSKKPVPPNVELSNEEYWAMTGNYNAQLEEYLKITNSATKKLQNLEYYTSPEEYEGTDYEKIIQAVNSGKPVIAKGKYVIDSTINFANKHNLFFDFSNSQIIYSGNSSAVKITNCTYDTFKFGTIDAQNGTGIELSSSFFEEGSKLNDYVQYINIDFVHISAKIDIYGNITGGWANEIRISNGQFAGNSTDSIGCYISNNKTGNTDGWYFNNIGVEGVKTGFKFEALKGKISNIFINECRTSESFTTMLETVGVNEYITINGSFPIYSSGDFFKLSANTNFSAVNCYDGSNNSFSSFIENGKIIATECVKQNLSDFNDIKYNSCYVFDQTSPIKNSPFTGLNNGTISTVYNSQIGMQILTSKDTKQMWLRYLWYGTFGEWNELLFSNNFEPIKKETITISYTKGTAINVQNVSHASVNNIVNAFILNFTEEAYVKLYTYNSVLFAKLYHNNGTELDTGIYKILLSYST